MYVSLGDVIRSLSNNGTLAQCGTNLECASLGIRRNWIALLQVTYRINPIPTTSLFLRQKHDFHILSCWFEKRNELFHYTLCTTRKEGKETPTGNLFVGQLFHLETLEIENALLSSMNVTFSNHIKMKPRKKKICFFACIFFHTFWCRRLEKHDSDMIQSVVSKHPFSRIYAQVFTKQLNTHNIKQVVLIEQMNKTAAKYNGKCLAEESMENSLKYQLSRMSNGVFLQLNSWIWRGDLYTWRLLDFNKVRSWARAPVTNVLRNKRNLQSSSTKFLIWAGENKVGLRLFFDQKPLNKHNSMTSNVHAWPMCRLLFCVWDRFWFGNINFISLRSFAICVGNRCIWLQCLISLQSEQSSSSQLSFSLISWTPGSNGWRMYSLNFFKRDRTYPCQYHQ